MVKNPPVMQETEVQSLGQEDSLEEGMATHSSIFAWRIPWTEEEATVRGVTYNLVTNIDTQQDSTSGEKWLWRVKWEWGCGWGSKGKSRNGSKEEE